MHDVFLGQSSRTFQVPGRGPDQLNRCGVPAENSLLTCSHLCSHIFWYNTIGFLPPCGCSWIVFWENSHSDMKLGLQTHLGAESQSYGTIELVPKSWKMAIIVPRRREGTWEGVSMATWCSGWICRMRGGLVHHTIMIPAALSFLLLWGACSRLCTNNISKWLVLYQNLQFFPVSNFFDC